jgi:hypothetical protein
MAAIWASSNRLTICRMEGSILFEELREAKIKLFEKCTPDMMWDFSKADLSGVSNDELRSILQIALTLFPDCMEERKRRKGITIWIGSNDLEFGLGRMLETHAEMMERPIPFCVVRTPQDALQFLAHVLDYRMRRVLGMVEEEEEVDCGICKQSFDISHL